MIKTVKPMVKCIECGGTKEYEISEFFCDTCDKEIDTSNKQEHNMLDITVFLNIENNDNDTKDYQFCSWKCLIEKLKTIKCDYFISLPELIYKPTKEGLNVKDFLVLLK